MMGMLIRSCRSMIPGQADGSPKLVQTPSGTGRYALIGFALPDKGYLFAVFSISDFDEAARILRSQLWLVTAVLLLASVILAVVLTRMFSRPIRAVTAFARRLTAGRYDEALPVRTRDEIGDLTAALNDLGVQLQKTDQLRKELIANVSHELRAPLAVIQGYAETVRDVTWPDEAKRTEQLGIISEEASRLSRIVTDILDYSRLQAKVEQVVLSEFAVCPVLEELIKKFELDALAKQLAVRSSCRDLAICFDRDQFAQVMVNLLNNAMNHADPGSEIIISAVERGHVSRIQVKNQGETIPEEELGLIWDRYYQGQQNSAGRRLGTGLGLAIVRSILEQHKVEFGVASQNRETVFWFDTCPPCRP
jgi:signal transduction histidine kinase